MNMNTEMWPGKGARSGKKVNKRDAWDAEDLGGIEDLGKIEDLEETEELGGAGRNQGETGNPWETEEPGRNRDPEETEEPGETGNDFGLEHAAVEERGSRHGHTGEKESGTGREAGKGTAVKRHHASEQRSSGSNSNNGSNRRSGNDHAAKNRKPVKNSRGRKRRIILCVLIAIFVVIVVAFAGFLVVKAMGRASLIRKAEVRVPSLVSDASLETGADEEGVVYRDGKRYRYNQNLITVLCMGIDSSEETLEAGEMGSGGQSDANFLLVIDETNHKLSVIAIPRDTMTDIDLYDMHGQYFDTVPAQLALQYAYGDGGELSCELTEKAVSNLMYNLPVNAYVSINMNAIPVLNDAVGGVTVEALEDIDRSGLSVKKGQSVTLRGEQARTYVRTRDKEDFSAISRLQRQKQYLMAFISKAFSTVREDLTLPVSMFNMITDYMVTDISASEVTYLAMAAVGCEFDGDSFYTVPGEQQLGNYYEEYVVDEDALYDLILEVFYIEETDLE